MVATGKVGLLHERWDGGLARDIIKQRSLELSSGSLPS